jgi:transcriptional regulator with XRE-family HTH domain
MERKVMEHEKELRLLANTIHQAREEKRITQEQLAEYLQVSPTHVRHLESGRRKPSIEKLISLCQILDVSFDQVVKGEPRPVSTAAERIVNCLEHAFSEEEQSLIADLIEAAADRRTIE